MITGIGVGVPFASSILSFRPSKIAGMYLWLDAQSINQADNTQVSLWTDSSGRGYDATQGTSAARPTLQTNELNGHPIVRFDGTDDGMTTSNFALALTYPYTVIVVHKISTLKDFGVVYNSKSGNNALGIHSSVSNAYLFNGSTVNLGITTPAFNIVYTEWNGASTKSKVNNGANITGSPGSAQTSLSGLSIGANPDRTASINGDIAEIIIYNRALTAAETLAVTQYLSQKWGITIA